MQVIPTVMNYAWGKVGMNSKVAQLSASNSTISDELPYAELWMGTHVRAPSSVVLSGQSQEAKTQNLAEHLGQELPYLFKVLSVNSALSIQAHPDKKRAAQLHGDRPDVYKDDNHKPEMALAITPFEAMCRFRPIEEIRDFLNRVPELVQLVGPSVAQDFLTSTSSSSCDSKAALRALFSAFITADAKVISTQVSALLSRLANDSGAINTVAPSCPGQPLDVRALVLRLGQQYPGDVGIFAPFFLNCFRLNVGEAMFMAANEPHAYLAGDCIEAMACSDNVVRAGLTPKLIDKETLCSMLTYDTSGFSLLSAAQTDTHTRTWSPPVPEFAVSHSEVPANVTYRLPSVSSDALFVVLTGAARATTDGSANGALDMGMGHVVLVKGGQTVTLQTGDEGVVLARCFAPVNAASNL